MIQVIRKYPLILILIFIFTNIYNLEAKILYDKSGIIITDLDLKNYIDLSLKSDNILLEKNKAIKKLVLQKKNYKWSKKQQYSISG